MAEVVVKAKIKKLNVSTTEAQRAQRKQLFDISAAGAFTKKQLCVLCG